jgi:putative GTP pyrophosphokinase
MNTHTLLYGVILVESVDISDDKIMELEDVKSSLKKEYDEIFPSYKKLGYNLREALMKFLDDENIEYLWVNYRIKNFKSFFEKIYRKEYDNPFIETEDLCGIRIICYYPADLNKISEIINRELIVIESVDKSVLLDPDRFGYTSLHFIVKIKKEWTAVPQYQELDNLKVEIQVRTILMHAWADLNHKFAYKKKEHIPDQFKRQLYRLSALFEIADEQFDSLRQQRNSFKHNLSVLSIKKKQFDITQDLNLDTLQAFLDFYFPEHKKDSRATIELLDEIFWYNDQKSGKISIKTLVDNYEKFHDELPKIELDFLKERYSELYDSMGKEKFEDNFKDIKYLAQTGIARALLESGYDDYEEVSYDFRELHGLNAA